ncbi:cell division protein FtsW [bacterium]|nr:cell division protein FtsW [bacterium]
MSQIQEKNSVDKVLLITVLLIIVIGVLTVFSSSSFYGKEKYNDSMIFFKMHMAKVGVGLLFLFIAMHINYHQYRWITPFVVMVLFMLLVAALFGPLVKGSHRAVVLFGKQLQPSAFMKLALIFYLATIFTKGLNARVLEGGWLYAQYLFVMLVAGIIFIEPDLGSALVVFSIGMAMFFIAGVPFHDLGKIFWGVIPVVFVGLTFFPYQRRRLIDFINPFFGRGEISYQVKQSIIGLARGGLTGVGYGEGKQKFLFLPEPFSDFALSSWGEEMGFIGICFLFILLLIILWRSVQIALNAPDRYGYLLAGGITAMIMVNALINAAVVVSLLPTTGLPFPFLSYGGSSLIMHLVSIGVLLNISRTRQVPFQDFGVERSYINHRIVK